MASVTTPCKDLNELNPLVKQQAELFLKKCEEAGLKIKITETYRSQERQNYLYCQGRTVAQATAKGISQTFAKQYCNPSASQVTWTLNSNHTSRKAFDICQNVSGDLYNVSVLKKAGEIAKTLGLDWGGDWKSSPDMPHIENQNLKPIPTSATNSTTTPPDKDYLAAVDKLHKVGIISDTSSWKTPNVKFIDALITKLGAKLYNVGSYEKTIETLVNKKIITSKDIWVNKTYKESHVIAMVKKLATLV